MATFDLLRWQPPPYPPSLTAYLNPLNWIPPIFSSKRPQKMYFRLLRWFRSLSFSVLRRQGKNLVGDGNHPLGRMTVKPASPLHVLEKVSLEVLITKMNSVLMRKVTFVLPSFFLY